MILLLLLTLAMDNWISKPAALPGKGLEKMEKYLDKRNKKIDNLVRKLKDKAKAAPGIQPLNGGGISVDGAIRPDLIRVESLMMVFGVYYNQDADPIIGALQKQGMSVDDLSLLHHALGGVANEPSALLESRYREAVSLSRYGYLIDANQEQLMKASVLNRTNFLHLSARTRIKVRRDWTLAILQKLSIPGRSRLLSYLFEKHGNTRATYR